METPYEDRLNKLVPRMVSKLLKDFDTKVNKARIKKIVIEELIERLNYEYLYFLNFNKILSFELTRVCRYYSEGVPIDEVIPDILRLNLIWEKQYKEILTHEVILDGYYWDVMRIHGYKITPRKIVSFFSKFISFYETIKILSTRYKEIQDKYQCVYDDVKENDKYSQFYNLTDVPLIDLTPQIQQNFTDGVSTIDNSNSYEIKWTGSKVDFIKLVYALVTSNNINDGKGTMKENIESFAKLFNFPVSNNYHSLLSDHINSTNDESVPFKFFDELKNSFQKIIKRRKKQKANQ